MIKKFTIGALFCCFVLFANSCKDEEAIPPPKPSFTVDKTVGDANETEFTFTVGQVNADAISVIPYGLENLSRGGILISSFQDGVATVKFKFSQVGTFNAVVVANNHTGDGTSENTYSDPISITIGSDRSALSDFTFDNATKTEVTGNDIKVIVPYGTNVTKLKAKFTSSPFSKVTVGGVEQKSGLTEVNYSSPQTFVVTSNRGTTSSYTVTVEVTPAETVADIKSVTGKEVSKATKDKVIPSSVDNTGRKIVLYDVYGTPSTSFDSIRLNYTLSGKFAIAKFGGEKLKQDSLLNLTSPKQIVVEPQDPNLTGIEYDVYAVAAPKLELAFNGLNPAVVGKNDKFDIGLTVLKATTVNDLVPTATITLPAGVTVSSVTTGSGTPFISGVTSVDFSSPVTFNLTVVDTNIGVTYTVSYKATVTVVP